MSFVSRLFTGLILIVLCSTAAQAEKHALIVGVTEYPALKDSNLEGPSNDAALVKAVLSQRGFQSKYVVELSERPEAEGKPLRKSILKELEKLASTSNEGDFVYLHFAGHGSRQPAQADDISETDGLDEIFLPADAAKWDKHIGSVVNAIPDNEIGAYLDRIRDRGANVWMVFDSCHSGTMTRGGGFGEVRYRQLTPGTLDLPEIGSIKTRGAGAPSLDERQRFTIDNGNKPSNKRGYLIAFSASQSTQTTPEMILPRKGEHSKIYGVFTYNMMSVLSRTRGISYKQLGHQILEQYRTLPWRASQPMISGGANLGDTVFDEDPVNLDIWPATLAKKGGAVDISAGRLQNFGQGARINLYSNALAEDEQFLGQAKVISAEALSSSATLIDMDSASLPARFYAVLKEPALDFTLSVATLTTKGRGSVEQQTLESAVLAAIESNPLLVSWEKGQVADIRVSMFENSLWFLSPDQSLPCEYQKITNAERQQCNIERTPQRLLTVPSPTSPQRLESSINSALTRIAQVENLITMQAHLGTSATSGNSPLQVTMTVLKNGKEQTYPLTQNPVFGDGDEVTVIIKNISRKPQDVSLLYRDAMYGITQLWPEAGDSNRVQAGEQLAPMVLEIYPEPEGLEDFIIMSQPGDGIGRDFSFLEQSPLGVVTRSASASSGGALNPQIVGQLSPLQLLLETALFANDSAAEESKVQTRGARKQSKPNLGSMQIYSWEVKR